MGKYIKNPIPVEAIEYSTGMEDGFDELDMAVNSGLVPEHYENPSDLNKIPYIYTLEGKHYINKGDYIITGVDGERYPCKREIFLKTYSPANI